MRIPTFTAPVAVIAIYVSGAIPAALAGEDVPTLIRQLKDSDPFARMKAAKTLGNMGVDAKDAIPALMAAMKDADEDVGAVAGQARGKIQKALDKASQGDAAADEKARTREKLAKLVKDLKGGSLGVRTTALRELQVMGSDAIEASDVLILATLDKSAAIQRDAIDALEKVNPALNKAVVTIMVDHDENAKINAIDGLSQMGEDASPAAPVLIRLYQRNLESRAMYGRSILNALAQMTPGSKDVEKIVLDAVGFVPRGRPNDYYATPDGPLRLTAIGLTSRLIKEGHIEASKAVKPLVSAIRDVHCSLAAIAALGELGPDAKEALPALKQLKVSPSNALREAASEAMDKIQP